MYIYPIITAYKKNGKTEEQQGILFCINVLQLL